MDASELRVLLAAFPQIAYCVFDEWMRRITDFGESLEGPFSLLRTKAADPFLQFFEHHVLNT